MGSDAVESMGHRLTPGDNVRINLVPDTRVETDRLFAVLSEGGVVEMAPTEMFWGDYYAAFTDRFGIRWMMNCASKT
jgi:PhnB protein